MGYEAGRITLKHRDTLIVEVGGGGIEILHVSPHVPGESSVGYVPDDKIEELVSILRRARKM
jgi:hypothetical protein